MTRDQSKMETLKKIKAASCGKEITEAILYHFRMYTIPEMGVSIEKNPSPVEVFGSPLLESNQSVGLSFGSQVV